MSKINSTKKIIIEEFPIEVQGWLKKLVEPLNRFLEQVYFALVNGLTIADNLKAQVNVVSIAANQDYPMRLSWRLNERPTAMLIAQIGESTGGAMPVHSMTWLFNNGTIEMTFVGLDLTKKYNVVTLGIV